MRPRGWRPLREHGYSEVESDFRHPPLQVTPESLVAHFRGEAARALRPIPNPHHESKVDVDAQRTATPAAVLIAVVTREREPTLLLTRRSAAISAAGHLAFPGGRSDPDDASPEETALREAEEEVGLDRARVRVLGRLGDYVTHSGYRIAPIVGLVAPPLDLVPHPGEVDEILEFPLATVFDSRSYQLWRVPGESGEGGRGRAHYFLEHGGATVSGPTLSLMMGLYRALLETHAPAAE